jgi:hypothetical protein
MMNNSPASLIETSRDFDFDWKGFEKAWIDGMRNKKQKKNLYINLQIKK